jgi:hypothetical protein
MRGGEPSTVCGGTSSRLRIEETILDGKSVEPTITNSRDFRKIGAEISLGKAWPYARRKRGQDQPQPALQHFSTATTHEWGRQSALIRSFSGPG